MSESNYWQRNKKSDSSKPLLLNLHPVNLSRESYTFTFTVCEETPTRDARGRYVIRGCAGAGVSTRIALRATPSQFSTELHCFIGKLVGSTRTRHRFQLGLFIFSFLTSSYFILSFRITLR
ncbi:uncharacterized protein LOC105423314 [Pogonomyrmex barbatus]|uniref:Uncharacterized protein LOC105423314 n=1 Tax=Pogonomyrmex barbatus TaxID=144034 RepID=A0A6I9VZ52_9HYME|nr:uncharacterized protein LOC105423314 [Pogonomyrmex barbatus]